MHLPDRIVPWTAILRGLTFAFLTMSAIGFFSPPAQARPRDEVMSGAFRCAPIGNSHQWLDCYYGAAQPARAALGLPPAPDAQIKLVSAPAPDGTSPADVAVRDEVLSGAFRCNTVGNDRQWLDCYYAAAQPMRAALGLSPVPAAKSISAGSFGMPAPPKLADVRRVSSRMADYKFDAHGIFTVTLANGQVWQQVAGDTTIAHWKKPAADYLVEISHGFLGSYNFQVKNEPGLFKVLRIS
ncbi:MAG TPA: hypothetical protein VHC39_18310 [Rhizomicrobium sp.]|nr:hypothetical protein [Rhizomicrobium sp.]